MNAHTIVQTSKMFVLMASMQMASCAAVDENTIQRRLESSIGHKFSESRWSKPTAAKRGIRELNAEFRAYEFSWANGCAYQVVVRVVDDIIESWRFTSDPGLCRQVMRGPLGS